MDRLRSMQVFMKVVDAGSFAAAALALDISAAAATRYLADLESHLGTRLLHRSTRKLSLTPAGSEYYERCRQILDEVHEAEALTGSLTRRPAGMLRVNAPVAFSLQLIMPHLHEYALRYPQVSVDLWLSDRVVDLAEEGYDVAIRIARAPEEHLVVRKLSTTRLVACASPKYLRQHGTPRVPAD